MILLTVSFYLFFLFLCFSLFFSFAFQLTRPFGVFYLGHRENLVEKTVSAEADVSHAR